MVFGASGKTYNCHRFACLHRKHLEQIRRPLTEGALLASLWENERVQASNIFGNAKGCGRSAPIRGPEPHSQIGMAGPLRPQNR